MIKIILEDLRGQNHDDVMKDNYHEMKLTALYGGSSPIYPTLDYRPWKLEENKLEVQ